MHDRPAVGAAVLRRAVRAHGRRPPQPGGPGRGPVDGLRADRQRAHRRGLHGRRRRPSRPRSCRSALRADSRDPGDAAERDGAGGPDHAVGPGRRHALRRRPPPAWPSSSCPASLRVAGAVEPDHLGRGRRGRRRRPRPRSTSPSSSLAGGVVELRRPALGGDARAAARSRRGSFTIGGATHRRRRRCPRRTRPPSVAAVNDVLSQLGLVLTPPRQPTSRRARSSSTRSGSASPRTRRATRSPARRSPRSSRSASSSSGRCSTRRATPPPRSPSSTSSSARSPAAARSPSASAARRPSLGEADGVRRLRGRGRRPAARRRRSRGPRRARARRPPLPAAARCAGAAATTPATSPPATGPRPIDDDHVRRRARRRPRRAAPRRRPRRGATAARCARPASPSPPPPPSTEAPQDDRTRPGARRDPITVWHRLLRGYGPFLLLAALALGMAVFVPSRVPDGRAVRHRRPGDAAGAARRRRRGRRRRPTARRRDRRRRRRRGAGGGGGPAAAAGVQRCADRAAQIPGDPYSPPCVAFSGDNGGATHAGRHRHRDPPRRPPHAGRQLQRRPRRHRRRRHRRHPRGRRAHHAARSSTTSTSASSSTAARSSSTTSTARARSAPSSSATAGTRPRSTPPRWPRRSSPSPTSPRCPSPTATRCRAAEIMDFGTPVLSREWYTSAAPLRVERAARLLDAHRGGHRVHPQAAVTARPPTSPAATSRASPARSPCWPRRTPGTRSACSAAEQVLRDAGQDFDVAPIAYQLDLDTMSNQAANLIPRLKSQGVTTILCGCDPIFPIFLSGTANREQLLPRVRVGLRAGLHRPALGPDVPAPVVRHQPARRQQQPAARRTPSATPRSRA